MTINHELAKITVTMLLIDKLCAEHPQMTLSAANQVLRALVIVASTTRNDERPLHQEAAQLWTVDGIQTHLPPW